MYRLFFMSAQPLVMPWSDRMSDQSKIAHTAIPFLPTHSLRLYQTKALFQQRIHTIEGRTTGTFCEGLLVYEDQN